LPYFDSSDAHGKSLNGKHANLEFHLDTTIMKNINYVSQVNTDSFYIKALSTKIDYEKLSPYFVSRLHDTIQHTLRQTTQPTKSKIHYPMKRHLKSRFQTLRYKN
jgi:hypothetical protein